MRQNESKVNLIEKPFTLGTHRLVWKSKGQCCGVFTAVIEKADDEYAFSGSGKLATRLAEQEITISVSLSGSFNLFGQLGGSNIEFTSPQGELKIVTTEVNPIIVKTRTRSNGAERRFDFNLPGPVLLQAYGRRRFQLQYPPIERLPLRFTDTNLANPIFGPLDVSLYESESEAQECIRNGLSPLALDNLLQHMQGFVDSVRKFLPEAALPTPQ